MSIISIEALKEDDIKDYITLMWESFEEKMVPTFSGSKEAGIDILAAQTKKDLGSGSYFTARSGTRIAGILMIKTLETARSSGPRDLKIFFKRLGFLKGLKALILISIEDLSGVKEDGLSIEALAVDKACRGMGIGKKLLAFCEEYAKKEGKKYMELGVVEKNQPALSLYHGFGFKKSRRYSMWIAERLFGYRVWYKMRKEIA